MWKSKGIGCLVVLNVLSLAAYVLIPMFADSIDDSIFFRLFVAPFMLTWPWGPPLLLMMLFALVGSRRPAKRASRIVAALLVYPALFLLVAGFAFVGHFAMTPTDGAISAGLAIAALSLFWYGFRPDVPSASQ